MPQLDINHNVSGISWAICKSAFRPRQITTPAPNHLVFYRPDALPATQPTASKEYKYLTPVNLKYVPAVIKMHVNEIK